MNAIESIRSQIKENTDKSRAIRNRIHATNGMERWSLWEDKRELGSGTRILLLAYACLRGRPYVQIERKVASGNEPSPSAILYAIESVLPQEGLEEGLWTKERVKAWLEVKEASEANEEAA